MTMSTIADQIAGFDAAGLAARMRRGELGAVEVTRACLDTIAARNPQLNAFCTVAADAALAAARDADARRLRGESCGPLHGVPVSIKDVTDTAGIRTTYGSPLFSSHVPVRDAAVVARLKRAGAIVIGKTNTPEFATGAHTDNQVFGPTRNPWDPRLTAGGSTGGGAASVAAGMVRIAEGTDFGGSLRIPAAFCGVVGLRPTAGLVPGDPQPVPWDLGQTHGPIGASAADCALALDVMIGDPALAPVSCIAPWKDAHAQVRDVVDLRGLRVAYVADLAGIGCEPEIASACRDAARALVAAGATVDEARLDLSEGRAAYRIVRGQWMVAQHLERLPMLDQLGPNLAGNLREGLAATPLDWAQAERTRAALWERVRLFLERWDLIVTPTCAIEPFPVDGGPPRSIAGQPMTSYIDWAAPTFLVTLVGLPAVSVPCGLSAAGLPIGAQLIGPRFSEPRLLAAARFVESVAAIGSPASRRAAPA